MSFIKKALKKIWEFVKEYWVEIVMVAAIVFTAGIATVGWAAFAEVMAAEGLMSAVGSTMWAGVTATAGSMSIGSGASGAAATAGGVQGMGLGAAAGWGGSGLGLGVTGGEYAANAAALGVAPSSAAINTANAGIAQGLTAAEAEAAGAKVGAGVIKGAAAEEAAVAAGGAGMSTGKAMLLQTGLTAAGAVASGYAEGKAIEERLAQNIPKAAWGVPTEERGGRSDGVENYLFEGAVMQPVGGGPASAEAQASALSSKQANRPQAKNVSLMASNMPGQSRDAGQFGGVAYNPKQMLGSTGSGDANTMMPGDPRRNATRQQDNFSLMPAVDKWKLQSFGNWG